MSGDGDQRDPEPDKVVSLDRWRRPANESDGPDQGKTERLADQLAAARDQAAALRARAATTEVVHLPPPAPRDPELVQIHAEAGRFYQACLAGSWVPGYLANRGLAAALLPASPWKIGYAPASWTLLTDHLRGLGHCDAALLCSGLVVNGKNGQLRDHFHDRLMIPLRAEDGIVTGFIGRRHPDAGDDRGPKYLNSPDTELFTKHRILAGLYEGRGPLRRGAQPVLVEGPLDAIAVSISAPGQFVGLAPCGTALTGDQVAALGRAVDLTERDVLIAFDGDQAGRKAAVRAFSHLIPATAKLTIAAIPEGSDPAATLAVSGRDGLAKALTADVRPLADFVVDARMEEWANGRRLVFAEWQLGALRAAAAVIATLPAGQVGHQAERLCGMYAERHGWEPEAVTREIINAVERHYESPPDVPLGVVKRAIAPPRPAADRQKAEGERHLRLVQPVPRERG
jgi:DNA primase